VEDPGVLVMMSDARFEILGYAVGFLDNDCGVIWREGFIGGLFEEGEPALEMVGIEGELKVLHHGVAFVATGGEEDGGPEVLEEGEVMGPVVDDGVEDGTDVGVLADFGVEAVYQGANFGFSDLICHLFSLRLVAGLGPRLTATPHFADHGFAREQVMIHSK